MKPSRLDILGAKPEAVVTEVLEPAQPDVTGTTKDSAEPTSDVSIPTDTDSKEKR